MPIKVIHTADLHFGVEVGPIDKETRINGRVLDFFEVFDSVIDFAEDNQADITLIAGDVFNHHHPSATVITEFSSRLSRLARICPVVIIIGNHDIPASLDKASVLDVYNVLELENVYIGWGYDVYKIQTKSGPIQVATFPYPFKAQFINQKDVRHKVYEEIHGILRQKIKAKINSLAGMVDNNIPSIFLGHLTVDGCDFGADAKEGDVSLESLIHPWDYVALGHIHKYQNMTEGMEIDGIPPVVYPGSLERVNFGEEKLDKGFIWIEIGEEVKCEFIEVDARLYKTLRYNVDKMKHPTEFILHKLEDVDIEGCVVRLIIRIAKNHERLLDMGAILRAIDHGNPYYLYSVAVNKLEDVRITRLEGIPLASMTPRIALKSYLTSLDIKNKELKELMRLAREIMEQADG